MKHFTISIDLEEWFHSNWFNSKEIVRRYYDGKIPFTDIKLTTRRLLDVFKAQGISTTFFCLTETSLRYPETLKMISEEGHEIAFHGNSHQKINDDSELFRRNICFGKIVLEKLSRSKVIGYRAPNFDMPPWGFEILSDTGFLYDSSIVPCLKIPGWYGSGRAPTYPNRVPTKSGYIVEFPLTVFPILRIPGCGGWFLRNFGSNWAKLLFRFHLKVNDLAVLYLHPWEISDQNPRFPEIPQHVFRRTGRWTLDSLQHIIQTFKNVVHFSSFLEYLEDNTDCLIDYKHVVSHTS